MTAPSRSRTDRGLSHSALQVTTRFGGPIVLVVLLVIFGITLPHTFLTVSNFQSLTEAQAVPGILALGLLFTLVANEFDFSGGAVISGASVAFALLTGQHGVNWAVAGMIVLVGALVIGLINGMLVGILHYNSFVATLAVGGIVAGVTVANSHGATLNEGIPRTVIRLGDRFHGIPLLDVSLLGVFVVVAFILRATVWGRHHDAIGKGREAAVLAGVRVRRHIVVAFMASAFLAGLAGLVLVAYLGSAPPNVGQSYTLSAFAAAFLGSTMLRPGFFNAEGTLVAIMLIAVGVNGLSLAGADSAIGQIFTGVVLLASVGLTRLEQLSRR